MTQAAFQSAFARLVVDESFRSSVANETDTTILETLTEREHRRLVSLARQPGIEITTTLYEAWRLAKVLTLLPFTAGILGPTRLARELRSFWTLMPATTLYFTEECLAFCDFLDGRLADEPIACAPDLVIFERAKLLLRSPDATLAKPRRVRLVLGHDPVRLFDHLADGRELRDIPAGEFVLEGTLGSDGEEQWRQVVSADDRCHDRLVVLRADAGVDGIDSTVRPSHGAPDG